MSTIGERGRRDLQKRNPRKYEAQLSYIVHTHGISELTDWVLKHGTEHEWLWWTSNLLETVTGERINNAVDIAALGFKETLAIRVAGHRLQGKLVKAFLGNNQEQQKLDLPA